MDIENSKIQILQNIGFEKYKFNKIMDILNLVNTNCNNMFYLSVKDDYIELQYYKDCEHKILKFKSENINCLKFIRNHSNSNTMISY